MCGIAGFYNLDGRPADPRVLSRMVDVQRHRGPDDQGLRLFSLRGGVSAECRKTGLAAADGRFEGALGFNRLSILDLSEQGHQPMANREGTVFLAFNGEIYNAFDYTAELEAAGFRFRSRSDTEVILYLYERHGLAGMLERLNGMFVVVIVDLKKGDVSIARDHFGIKPLYWSQAGGTVLFASEVKSFFSHPQFVGELDVEYLDEYLGYRYCAGEGHLLKGVRQLRPGHWLHLTPAGVSLRRYWQLPDPPARSPLSAGEALSRFERVLADSVSSQLLADVKVGCQLSGGIDSSQVTVLARKAQADIDTFSIVFEDPAYSEDRWISRAANAAGADSHRFFFTPDSFIDNVEAATWHLDQPVNHPNSLGIFLLAQRARRLVTVLLSGEGADELMGGYPRFFDAMLRHRLAPLSPVLERVPWLQRRLDGDLGPGDPAERFITATLFQSRRNLDRLRHGFRHEPALERRRAIFGEGGADYLSNCIKFEMQTYMVDLLVRQDKMTMAHSLENRVPYLDRNVVALVRELPPEHLVAARARLGRRPTKMRGTKIILKRLAERTFGGDFVYRPKQGFGLPLALYFADRRFRELMSDRILPGIRKRGLVAADVVEGWWSRLGALEEAELEGLWICLALEMWAQIFLDRAGVPATNEIQPAPSWAQADAVGAGRRPVAGLPTA